ncbi:MAG: undecaprenyl-diphosphate phosphatase [Pseudomonadales bacterium]|nr:undecaprenyl-diphosphate phosphatase [Pseudomonadales bacterium]
MDVLYIVLLALIQGITEFLPISSSAHLILPAQLSSLPDQGLVFDVAAHLGSLIAVMFYFRRDLLQLSQAWLAQVFKQQSSQQAQLAWQIIFATIPAVIMGLCIEWLALELRSLLIIATTTVLFGIILGVADKLAQNNTRQHTNMRDAWLIGLLQCLALIPGTSRSGITMTGALLLGLSKQAAARFSFLLSIPLILAASALKSWQLLQSDSSISLLPLLLVMGFSGLTAWLCIHLFLRLIDRIGFMPFVIYRLLLGISLFTVYLVTG